MWDPFATPPLPHSESNVHGSVDCRKPQTARMLTSQWSWAVRNTATITVKNVLETDILEMLNNPRTPSRDWLLRKAIKTLTYDVSVLKISRELSELVDALFRRRHILSQKCLFPQYQEHHIFFCACDTIRSFCFLPVSSLRKCFGAWNSSIHH